MDRIDAIRRADNAGQTDQRTYAAQCRAMFNGHQWIEELGGGQGLHKYINKVDQQYASSPGREPVKTTVNRLTEHIVRNKAMVNPKRFELTGVGVTAGASPQHRSWGEILKAAGNATLRRSGLIRSAQRASFERQITGLHGLGFRIIRTKNGTGIEPFDFDGHRLSMDPENGSMNLLDHRDVIYTEAVTWDHAVRLFGEEVFREAGIRKEDLPTMSALMPVECSFYKLTHGRMYHHYAQHSNAPSLVLSWAYHKDSPDRFDRLYAMADTGVTGNSGLGSRNRVLLNADNPENPYAGTGMNMGLIHGYMRTGSRYPISDVGLMTDAQRKVNIAWTIHFQGLWNFVNALLVVDQSMLAGSTNLTADDIWDQIEEGMVRLDRSGNRGGVQPYFTQSPQPSPTAAADAAKFENDVRSGSMQSPGHVGDTKSHVPEGVAISAMEASQLPLDDRVDEDIATYESVIECMASTAIGLARAGSDEIRTMLMDEGLTEQQLQSAEQIPLDRMPVSLKIDRSGVFRRSRMRRLQEIQYLQSVGGVTPEQLRMFMAELDMPVSDSDQEAEQYAVEVVARTVRGDESSITPLGEYFSYFEREARAAMMSHIDDEEVTDRLMELVESQLEMERAYQALLAPPEQGQAQQQQGPQDPLGGLPASAPLGQILGAAAS